MNLRTLFLGLLLTLTGCGNERESPPALQDDTLQVISAFPYAGPPQASSPQPALWTASDADTTVYLFGSLHVLPESLEWSSPKLETALDKANAVYFETDVDPPPASLSTLVSRLGLLTPPERLSDHLSADERKSVARAAGEAAMSMYALEAMRPWLAAVSISQAMIERTGLRSDLGVERVLHARARASGKDIRRLESLEEQLRALSDLPERVQIRFLIDGVSRLEAETALLDELVETWSRGETDRIADIMVESEARDIPEVHQSLITARNVRWADRLKAAADAETGAILVVVGAGHLVGEDSLLSDLETRGLAIKRIQ
jgi:uncharacterized protein YbaP (TraB family)